MHATILCHAFLRCYRAIVEVVYLLSISLLLPIVLAVLLALELTQLLVCLLLFLLVHVASIYLTLVIPQLRIAVIVLIVLSFFAFP